MSIKEIVFKYVGEKNGFVDFEELTQLVLSEKPESKWKISHWSWYKIKICFYKRHLELYGNNLVGMSDFNDDLLPEWYSDIKWLEPILHNNWKERIDNLLAYRLKHLKYKYNKAGAERF